ncbi:MAG: hypothetical protein SYR96_11860 [Actinomycetota bacterium]|nr:hypothetical protein [Actinomycetota bacterium]
MTQPRGRLYVNPDGVVSVGDAYGEHVQIYDTYLANLVSLRERYANAWGDDEMGQQFSTKFLDGLDNLEKLIGGVRGTLAYTSEGLRSFGKAYAEADESAMEVGRRMQGDFEESFTPRARSLAPVETTAETPVAQPQHLLARPLDGVEAPLARTQHALARPLDRVEAGTETPVLRAQRALARPADRVEEGAVTPNARPQHALARPLDRVEEGAEMPRLFSRSVNPGVTPMQHAISSMMMKPDFPYARIGGEPLPEGYQLLAFNPFPDGTVRLDANLYESITPLAGTPVTTADGKPIDAEGRQLFVVKDNPAADPAAPGYQQMVLSYTPDGTPTPLLPGDA